MYYLLGILSLFFITGCNMTSNLSVLPEFNKSSEQLQVTVHNYDSRHKLNKNVPNSSKGLNGQAVYAVDDLICDIHIYKPSKITLDDNYALTLGHELMHCLYGNYHTTIEE